MQSAFFGCWDIPSFLGLQEALGDHTLFSLITPLPPFSTASFPCDSLCDATNIELVGGRCNPRKILEMPLFVSHVGKSMYAVQLERWFNLFGRENFKVWGLLFRDLGVGFV